MADIETERPWSEDDDMDALSLLQCDAQERANDAEQTARAFNAVVVLTDVVDKVVNGRASIVGSEAFIEQLARLLSVARDYYAMNPDAHA